MAPAAEVGNGHRAVSSIDVPALKKKERADGNACVLATGTANPPDVVEQNAYADYYFRVTQSEHMTQLKHKFRRMCDRSCIRKCHTLLTDDLLRKYPALAGYEAASLHARQEIVVPAVPRLGKEAADKAALEWGPVLRNSPGFCEYSQGCEFCGNSESIHLNSPSTSSLALLA